MVFGARGGDDANVGGNVEANCRGRDSWAISSAGYGVDGELYLFAGREAEGDGDG